MGYGNKDPINYYREKNKQRDINKYGLNKRGNPNVWGMKSLWGKAVIYIVIFSILCVIGYYLYETYGYLPV